MFKRTLSIAILGKRISLLRLHRVAFCTKKTLSHPEKQQQVPNKDTKCRLLYNFCGEYGKDFVELKCFVCDKTFTSNFELASHLYQMNHVEKVMKLKQFPMNNFVKKQLKSNFDLFGKLLAEQESKLCNMNAVSGTRLQDMVGKLDVTNIVYPKHNNNNSGASSSDNSKLSKKVTKARTADINYHANNHEHTLSAQKKLDGIKCSTQNVSQSNPLGVLSKLDRVSDKKVSQILYSINNHCKTPQSMIDIVEKYKSMNDIRIYTCAIKKCGNQLWWNDCLRIIDMVYDNNKCKRDIFFYSTLMNSGAQNDRIIDVFKYYQKMIQDGIKPNVVILSTLLKGCVSRGNVTLAHKIWRLFDKENVERNSPIFTLMIKTCGNAHDTKMAEYIFKQCKNPSQHAFNALLNAFANSKSIAQFEKYLQLAINSGLEINQHHCGTVMGAYLKFKQPLKAIETFKKMIGASRLEPQAKQWGMLQFAYFQLQKQYFNDKNKLDEYYKQVTEIVPSQYHKRAPGEYKNGLVMILAILHYFGQTRWIEAVSEIERLVDKNLIDINKSFWNIDKVTKKWQINLHELPVEVAIFALRHVLFKDKHFICQLGHDLWIVTGLGKHRIGYQRGKEYSLKDIIISEIEQWFQSCTVHESKHKGYITVKRKDIVDFYRKMGKMDGWETRLLNQKTDTCSKFGDNWTDVSQPSGLDS